MSPDPYLAPSLVVLRDEANAHFPQRDKASDGWLGDAAHQTRPSSHNPNPQGVVRGLDIDVDDNDPTRDLRRLVVEAAIRDSRVWYVISNGVIYSRTHNFAPRPYTGANAHFHHVHVSLLEEPAAWNDTSPWLSNEEDEVTPEDIDKIADRVVEKLLNAVVDSETAKSGKRKVAGMLTSTERLAAEAAKNTRE